MQINFLKLTQAMVLISLGDGQYWLTERQTIQNNSFNYALYNVMHFPETDYKTNLVGVLFDLVYIVLF